MYRVEKSKRSCFVVIKDNWRIAARDGTIVYLFFVTDFTYVQQVKRLFKRRGLKKENGESSRHLEKMQALKMI